VSDASRHGGEPGAPGADSAARGDALHPAVAQGHGDLAVVITSVQAPTPAVRAWAARLHGTGAALVVVGDRVGPHEYALDGARFVGIEAQRALPFELARVLPEGHYARKNLGYLVAWAAGARRLYETDDDNAPLPTWGPREERVDARAVRAPGWHNSFAPFTDEWVWPRGLPLDAVGALPHGAGDARASASAGGAGPGAAPVVPAEHAALASHDAPIQQGLVSGEPDVDAAWRLLNGGDAHVAFRTAASRWFGRGAWTPFNSQSTWWWPRALPLAYLPATCSFRTTDIWRGLVALRCLWALGTGLAVHAPEVVQARNPHDLLRDFEQEVPGYLRNAAMARLLDALPLEPGAEAVVANQRACYAALADAGHMAPAELPLLDAWQRDVARLA